MARAILLVSPVRPWRFSVSRSAREMGRWQLTRMEGEQPTGHTTWDSAQEAIDSACGRFVRGQAPVGDRTFAAASGSLNETKETA